MKKNKNIFKKLKQDHLDKADEDNSKGLMAIDAHYEWHEILKLKVANNRIRKALDDFSKKASEIALPIFEKNEKHKSNLAKGAKAATDKRISDAKKFIKIIFEAAKELKSINTKLSNADLAKKLIKLPTLSGRYKDYRSIQNILNRKK